MEGVAVANSDWDEHDWESVWSERLDLGKEDGGGDLIDYGCDNCGDDKSCNVSITNFENLEFPFSIRWR